MAEVLLRRCACYPYKIRDKAKRRTADGCRFCVRDGGPICGLRVKSGICTRAPGHRGDCVACGHKIHDLRRQNNRRIILWGQRG